MAKKPNNDVEPPRNDIEPPRNDVCCNPHTDPLTDDDVKAGMSMHGKTQAAKIKRDNPDAVVVAGQRAACIVG